MTGAELRNSSDDLDIRRLCHVRADTSCAPPRDDCLGEQSQELVFSQSIRVGGRLELLLALRPGEVTNADDGADMDG